MERYLAIVKNGIVENIIVVNPDDTATINHFGGLLLPIGSPVSVGWRYDGFTFSAPPKYTTLAEAVAEKLQEIKTARDAACFADVVAIGHTWQADKRNQELLGQAVTLAQAGLPLPAVWRDANNVDVPVASIADLLAIAGAIAAQTQAAYAHSWTLKAQVAAATTIEDVEAVTW